MPALVLVAATILLATADPGDADRAQFGRSLLIGGILGLTFIPVQWAVQNELRRQGELSQRAEEAAASHRDLLLQLSLRNNLRDIDLHGQELAGSYLISKDLAGANLRGTDLSRADLEHADLRGADLTGTRLDGATLTGARFDRARLGNTSFAGADLRHARFEANDWRGGIHPGPLLFAPEPNRIFVTSKGALRTRRAGESEDFSNANLSFATLTRADLSFANFEGANLRAAEFDDVILEGADFAHTTLMSFFNRVDLCNASLRDALVLSAAFFDVNLRFADLRGTKIVSAGLSHVDLRGARAIGFRQVTDPRVKLPPDLPHIGGYGNVVITRNAPELPPTIARVVGAREDRRLRVRECTWGLFGNRLEPLAPHVPPPRST